MNWRNLVLAILFVVFFPLSLIVWLVYLIMEDDE